MSEENISLLNCDFSQKKPRLTSPLSITAVKLVGATLDDLRFISLDEYLKNNIKNKNLEKDLQIERYKHHENNRISLIKEAKHIREEIEIMKIAEEEERIQMAEGKKQQLEQEEIEIMKKLKTTTQMHEQMVENYQKLSGKK